MCNISDSETFNNLYLRDLSISKARLYQILYNAINIFEFELDCDEYKYGSKKHAIVLNTLELTEVEYQEIFKVMRTYYSPQNSKNKIIKQGG